MMKESPRHIFLAGFAGSGKSTIGKLLARTMRRSFVDLDDVVEHSARTTIADLIQSRGERYFRQIESKSLLAVCRHHVPSAVVALGGGTLLSAANRRAVARYGVTVYLKCSKKVLWKRLMKSYARPILGHARNVREFSARVTPLLSKRMPGYESCVHTVTVTHRTRLQIVRRIRGLIE